MTKIEAKYREKCATPSDIFEHLPTLRRYAEECCHVTELGVRTVVSTWAFLAARPNWLVSVDIAAPDKHGGNLAEVIEAAAESGTDFRFIEANDLQIELERTDLLFIDTWHVCEQLRAELEMHADQARKFIILHDTETFGFTGEMPGYRGLLEALNPFLAAHREWKRREHFTNCNGLTVLERI